MGINRADILRFRPVTSLTFWIGDSTFRAEPALLCPVLPCAGSPLSPPQRLRPVAGDPGPPPQRLRPVAGDPGLGGRVDLNSAAPGYIYAGSAVGVRFASLAGLSQRIRHDSLPTYNSALTDGYFRQGRGNAGCVVTIPGPKRGTWGTRFCYASDLDHPPARRSFYDGDYIYPALAKLGRGTPICGGS